MRARMHAGDVRSKLCNICSGFPYIIIGGDFNCGATDWSSGDLPAIACDHFLLEITEKFGFTEHEEPPTRKVSGRIIDLAFSTISSLIQACHFDPGISDHHAILFEVDVAPKSAPNLVGESINFIKGILKAFVPACRHLVIGVSIHTPRTGLLSRICPTSQPLSKRRLTSLCHQK